jgi:hypothetical protein
LPQGRERRAAALMKKSLAILTAIFIMATVYWDIVVRGKKRRLEAIARPLQEACQSQAGCVQAPPGWIKERDSSGAIYFQKDGESMSYTTTGPNFQITWHIATDVFLYASGGKGKPLEIVRRVE